MKAIGGVEVYLVIKNRFKWLFYSRLKIEIIFG